MKKIKHFLHSGWFNLAEKLESPNFDYRPKNIKISLIVIHCISLPPNQFKNNFIQEFFTNNLDFSKHEYFQTIKDLKVSAHFFISRNGKIYQFVSCKNRAWHAGKSIWKNQENCNDFSIGIELEGTDTSIFEENQYLSLEKLILELIKNYPTIQDIVGHQDIAPERKTDPGKFFDWSRIHKILKLYL